MNKLISKQTPISDLADGECGYLGGVVNSTEDNFPWLLFNRYYYTRTVEPKQTNQSPWIGRKDDLFYIELFCDPCVNCLPTTLAFEEGYPLDKKIGIYYVIPCNEEDRKKHPLVQRNVEAVKDFVALKSKMLKVHGVNLSWLYEKEIVKILGNDCRSFDFKLIDDRVNAYVSGLKDGECAYVENALACDTEGKLWFNAFTNYVKSTQGMSTNALYIARKDDFFYVKFINEFVCTNKKTNAWLGYEQAYPLDNKIDDYYVIPCLWKDRAKHPLVQRNIKEFKECNDCRKKLQDNSIQVITWWWDTKINEVLAAYNES